MGTKVVTGKQSTAIFPRLCVDKRGEEIEIYSFK